MSMQGQRFGIEGVCRGLSLNPSSQMPYRRVNDQGPAQLPSASQPAVLDHNHTSCILCILRAYARPVGQGVSKGARMGFSLRRTVLPQDHG